MHPPWRWRMWESRWLAARTSHLRLRTWCCSTGGWKSSTGRFRLAMRPWPASGRTCVSSSCAMPLRSCWVHLASLARQWPQSSTMGPRFWQWRQERFRFSGRRRSVSRDPVSRSRSGRPPQTPPSAPMRLPRCQIHPGFELRQGAGKVERSMFPLALSTFRVFMFLASLPGAGQHFTRLVKGALIWWSGKKIAVIGPTASGKDSFLARLQNKEIPEVHSNSAMGEKIKSFKVKLALSDHQVIDITCKGMVNIGGETDYRDMPSGWLSVCKDANVVFYVMTVEDLSAKRFLKGRRIRSEWSTLAARPTIAICRRVGFQYVRTPMWSSM